MKDKPTVQLVSQTGEFFRALVMDALDHQKIHRSPETEVYLVNLLSQFLKTDQLFSRNKEGEIREEPLALLLKEALEQSDPVAQNLLFRHIGDVSLYMAGYFQDSLSRKLVDVDYYIDLGGAAYQRVASHADGYCKRSTQKKSVYEELAKKFASFVDVLAEVSDKTSPKTEKDILRLYELWIRTKSERAAKALQEAGIIPVAGMKKDWQQ
ncbi:MAG: hypothetical protein ACO3A2_03950 [Bdellovibrionia bacterium]